MQFSYDCQRHTNNTNKKTETAQNKAKHNDISCKTEAQCEK